MFKLFRKVKLRVGISNHAMLRLEEESLDFSYLVLVSLVKMSSVEFSGVECGHSNCHGSSFDWLMRSSSKMY